MKIYKRFILSIIFLIIFLCNVQAQEKSYTQYFDEISGTWQAKDRINTTIRIHLDDVDNYIKVGTTKYLVELVDIDRDNHIVKLKTTASRPAYDSERNIVMEDYTVYYYFRQIFSDGQNFYLTCFQETDIKTYKQFKLSFLHK